jgi:SAM-dependent methyltransferase
VDLGAIQQGWDQAANRDAMFNILTEHGKQDGGWTPEEFFEHGRQEIDEAMSRLEKLGVVHGTSKALDFGCGVGRLTQALAHHYEQVDGVDISPEMIRQARQYNHPRCTFHTNPHPDLRMYLDGTFDLVYTWIVLQHMPQHYQEVYVKDFIRILKPEGVAMFELPDGPDYQHPDQWLSMYCTSRPTVVQWLDEANADLRDVELIPEPSQWTCYRYTATPKGA